MSDFQQHLPEFFGNHPYLCLTFVGLVIAIVTTEVLRLFRGIKQVTPAGLTQLINRENALVIDLSAPADFEKGHVPGAKNVAMAQFDPENKELTKVKDMPVALYCRTGATAEEAAKRLVKAGFQRVFILGGGVASWVQADLPLAKGRN